MKKLLLITSLTVFCTFFGACQSHSKSSSKSSKNSSATKSSEKNSTVGGNTSTKGTKKDSLAAVQNGTAIIHPQQNQSQIDSTKNSKTKNKR